MRRQLSLLVVMSCFLFSSSLYSQQLPDNFSDQQVNISSYQPVGMTFSKDKMFLWERGGKVHIIDTNGVKLPTPLIDITREVANWGDHGLLSFALDPDFEDNGHFYLFYAVERHYLLYYGTPQFHIDTIQKNQATIARITRYTADPATNFTTTLPNSRKVLVGETKDSGFPILHFSHGVGSLAFGTDGTLMASFGDGSSFLSFDIQGDSTGANVTQAIADGIITPDMDLGVYKSQYLKVLNGKIIRIDPNTGDGIPSNPYYDAGAPRSAESRIWALGLRNPYRMVLRPNTGSHYEPDGNPGALYVGDVGAGNFEEINIVERGGNNYGWPLLEGLRGNWGFMSRPIPENPMAPNPLFGTNGCTQEFFNFRDLLKETPVNDDSWALPNPCDPAQNIPKADYVHKVTNPVLAWNNYKWNPPSRTEVGVYDSQNNYQIVSIDDPSAQIESDTFSGNCVISGDFYTGTAFPEKYHGVYFAADFSWWIKAFYFDDEQNLVKVEPFGRDIFRVLSLSINPYDGCIYYITLNGAIRKICYGGNPLPIAIGEADKYYGSNTETITFSSDQSYSPFEYPLTYEWDFGDGTTSTEKNPTHTFSTTSTTPTSFTVTLTVTDSVGGASEDEILISLNNTPPKVDITSFENGALYPINRSVNLSLLADVSDEEHTQEELTYEWQTFLHHDDHFHPESVDTDAETYTTISPVGCVEEDYHYRIELTVTDPEGLSTMQSKRIYPNCNGKFVDWINFETTLFEDHIQLDWTTENEEDVIKYEVQRSPNVWNFKTIGTVTAANTAVSSSYIFNDENPIWGWNHYRLKIFKSDGSFDYSSVRLESFPLRTRTVYSFPNPAKDIVTFEFYADVEEARIQLFESSGKLVKEEIWYNLTETERKTLNLDYLPRGIYLYLIELDRNKIEQGKIILGE